MLAQKIMHVKTVKGAAVDLTRDVEEFVAKSGIDYGIANVFAAHTTCALSLQENDRLLLEDIFSAMKRATEKEFYLHPENAQNHIMSSMLGHSVTIPVISGKLELGTWQSILLFEFDRTARRKVVVTVMGESLPEEERKKAEDKLREGVV